MPTPEREDLLATKLRDLTSSEWSWRAASMLGALQARLSASPAGRKWLRAAAQFGDEVIVQARERDATKEEAADAAPC